MRGHALGDYLIPPTGFFTNNSKWTVKAGPLTCCGFNVTRRPQWSLYASTWKNIYINTVKLAKESVYFRH